MNGSDCGHSERELVDLLDDDPSPDRRERLVARIEECEACAKELRRLADAWDELAAPRPPSPPADARAAVLAHAREGAGTRRSLAGILLGGLGSLGGYLVLSLLHPIPSAVEFCQVRIFQDPAMSLGQVCLIYAAVAALYAGVPVGVTAYLSADGGARWKLGLAVAAVFTLLAVPVSVLEFGPQDTVITLTVLGGLVAGAAGGGLTGGLARGMRRAAGARA